MFFKVCGSVRYVFRVLRELVGDLVDYYWTPYPILLIVGAFRRIRRHLKILWLPRGPGRAAISEEMVDLILDMKRSNWIWGALRISQELRLLGIAVHKKTVSRILREHGLRPPPRRFDAPSWKVLLKSIRTTWAMDFSCVMDLLGYQVFILVILEHARRELIFINVTLHPNRLWLSQQIRNALFDHPPPKLLIVDHDGIYGKWLSPAMAEGYGMKVLKIPIRSPWWNGRVERFHKSLKTELLNRLVVINVQQVQMLCFKYRDYYNSRRPHQALGGNTPCQNGATIIPISRKTRPRVRKIPELDSLITRFELAA